ncbi:periplasmic heavy metal sensor [Oceaniglobus roseus]|uniref:periplasmic heavy metal sensor n=1 Tax=Oceaniglobus roseus TaxID=1737570 RepID=UPI000C7EAAEC|nr:periplasmic heavy metal sensor [Kandeliimicrobium roseum]
MALSDTLRRWTASRWLLVISLALNLAVLGAVVGAAVSHGPGRHGHDHGRGDRLREAGNVPYFMALTKEQRQAIRDDLGLKREDFRRNREALRQRFEAALATLRMEPFDAARFSGLLAEQRDTLFQRQQLGEALLADRIARMSAAERAAYADRLDRSLERGPRGND